MFILRKSLKLYATLLFEVVGNLEYRYKKLIHAKRKDHYAILVFKLNLSCVFKCKINITLLFSNMSWKGLPQSEYKSTKKNRDIAFNYHELYLIFRIATFAFWRRELVNNKKQIRCRLCQTVLRKGERRKWSFVRRRSLQLRPCGRATFEGEEEFFGIEAAGVTGQTAVAADDAVAGDDDGDRVGGIGGGYGADGLGVADAAGQFGVGDGGAVGDFQQLRPDRTLEGRSREANFQVERLAAAREVLVQLGNGAYKGGRRPLLAGCL